MFSSIAIATLVACGGGGGGTVVNVSTPQPAPAPTVSVTISAAKTTVGAPVTVSWTSTNATSCVGMDAMSGSKALNSSEQVTPTAGGQYTYTISCDGDGGTAKQSVALVVPIPVFKTSYENAKGYGLPRLDFPASLSDIQVGMPLAWGAGDFFQTGNIDIFTAKQNYTSYNTTVSQVTGVPQYQSDFQFWQRNPVTGAMTLKLTYKGCLHPRKGVVADFNNDRAPDVFVACHGFDGPNNPGEKSKLVLSDGNGGFTVTDVNEVGFYHGAAASDINGDGWPDLVVANIYNADWHHPLYVYVNNKDGTFTKDESRIKNVVTTSYFSVELVDVNGDGILDLIAGGHEYDYQANGALSSETAIYYGDGNGNFGNAKTVIPPVIGQGVVQDFTVVKDNGNTVIYVDRTSDYQGDVNGYAYGGYLTEVVQSYNLTTNTSNVVLNVVANPIPWWLPSTQNGQIGVVPFSTAQGAPGLFIH